MRWPLENAFLAHGVPSGALISLRVDLQAQAIVLLASLARPRVLSMDTDIPDKNRQGRTRLVLFWQETNRSVRKEQAHQEEPQDGRCVLEASKRLPQRIYFL